MQFDLTAHFSLTESVHRIGVCMFGDEWLGLEIDASPVSGLAEHQAQLLKAQSNFDTMADQFDAHVRTPPREYTPENSKAHRDLELDLLNRREAARRHRDSLSEPLEFMAGDQARFDRRTAAENTLQDYFANKDLTLICRYGIVIEWKKWSQYREFKIHFPSSAITAPEDLSSQRTLYGCVEKSQFRRLMADKFKANVKSAMDIETEAAEWFAAYVKGVKISPGRATALHDLQEKFDGLSGAAAKRIWTSHAPKEWTAPGRKSVS